MKSNNQWLISINLVSVVLIIILLVNVLSLNQQIKSLSVGSNQTAASVGGLQLANVQSSVDSLTNAVNAIKANTSNTVKPSNTLSCSGSTFSYGSSTGSITLTCNPL